METITKKNPADVFAQVIRVVTVPPLLVSALLILVFFLRQGVFGSATQLVFALLFLVVIPLLAYPIYYLVPSFKKKGREFQRKLAFVFNLVGYIGSVVYGLIRQVSPDLLFIFCTYLVSVLVLIIFNKLLKIRASGHACGTTGPLLFLVYFLGPYGILPCLVIAVGVVWSSLRLKRHTVGELLLGATVAFVAFLLSILLIPLIGHAL